VTLATAILAAVERNPGIVTTALCRELRTRKSVVLATLEALQREQLLRFEKGRRGARCWFAVDAELGCSHGSGQAVSTNPPTAKPETRA